MRRRQSGSPLMLTVQIYLKCRNWRVICLIPAALESKLVSQFCEDENGALIYNRITNGINGHNGLRFNGYDSHADVLYGNNGYGSSHQEHLDRTRHATHSHGRDRGDTFTLPINPAPISTQVCFPASLTETKTDLYCNFESIESILKRINKWDKLITD